MAEKKIVSIEDRIPKLKESRRKKSNRRLIMYLSFFFLLIAIIIYLQSSLSEVKSVEVSGNDHVDRETILSLSGLTPGEDNYWKVDGKALAKKIEQHEEISAVQVDKHFPSTVEMKIEEYQRVGYVEREGSYYPILETGKELTNQKLKNPHGDAPLLLGFDRQSYLEEMTRELQQLPSSVTQLISEVQWTPSDKNPYKLHLYMNDGFEVEASIRNFSQNMRSYPSIIAQLEPGQRGIIHIDVGAYFEEYPQQEKEGEESDEANR